MSPKSAKLCSMWGNCPSSYPVVTPGTILEKAKLVMNVVPGIAECDECDELFNVIEHEGYCPNCGSFDKTVLSGETCTVKEIHIPES